MLPIGPFLVLYRRLGDSRLSQRCSAASFNCAVDVNSLSSRQKTARSSRGELAAVRHTSVRGNLKKARCLLRLRNLKRYHA